MAANKRNVEQVIAPSPWDPDKEVRLRVDRGIVGKLGEIASTHRIYQMYYNVCGYPPPVNNIGYYERHSTEVDDSRGIRDAHAVFQGLKRPHLKEDGDKSVLIYITKPAYIYKYKPGMACVVARNPFPKGAVFAIYVNMDEGGDTGEIFNWELLKCAFDNDSLPDNYNERYDTVRWQK
ncbi:MAG: hypothetical protein RQ899_01905 [Pseudomonadales bacterium]|nr:hypothetical protein [Pseudomonadales bacterium]